MSKKHTEKSKKKMSEARRKWWKNNPEKVEHAKMMIKKHHSHWTKGLFGEKSPGWKGGRYTTERDKYIYTWAPNHPNAVKGGKGGGNYVLEHRLVMEKILGRYLTKKEDVNHINGNKKDNRPENLRLVSHNHHYEEHICPKCNFRYYTQ